jgi:hypothetical protein
MGMQQALRLLVQYLNLLALSDAVQHALCSVCRNDNDAVREAAPCWSGQITMFQFHASDVPALA